MPKAVVDLEATERKELQTCPPDGFVLLRRMSYGQKLQRQSMAMKTSIAGSKGKTEMNLETMQQETTAFEFRHCIADHNLEDENGLKLDFNNPANVFRLDPRTGEEISEYIGEMNNYEETEEAKNSEIGS